MVLKGFLLCRGSGIPTYVFATYSKYAENRP